MCSQGKGPLSRPEGERDGVGVPVRHPVGWAVRPLLGLEGLEGAPPPDSALGQHPVPGAFPSWWPPVSRLPMRRHHPPPRTGRRRLGERRNPRSRGAQPEEDPGLPEPKLHPGVSQASFRLTKPTPPALQSRKQRPRAQVAWFRTPTRESPASLATSAPCHCDVTGRRAETSLFAHLFDPIGPKTSL